MEKTVSEHPLSQEQYIAQLHAQHYGTANGSVAQLEQDQIERCCPRRWTRQRGTGHGGSFGGDYLRQDIVQIPLCSGNLQGKCCCGAFCKYQHSESGEHDISRFFLNEHEKLGAVATVRNSQLCRENGDTDSTTRFSCSGCRSRSPCYRFQKSKEKTVDLKPLIKTYARKNYSKRKTISGEETMHKEMIDASEQGTPSCSLVEALSSDPNIVSVSVIPVDMKLSVSRNDDLENVLVDDHPVKEKVKKKRKRKRPDSASCEETVKEEASKLGMSVCASVATSSCNPNIVSATCIPVDMVLHASRNNNLENVLLDDHPAKKKVKKKRKRKRPNSASSDVSAKEVTEASKPRAPTSSLVETPLSNPMIVSGVPVDMEMGASRNNDLENVLVKDHILKKKVKKKRKKKRQPNSASFNIMLKEEATEASTPGIPVSSLVETSMSYPNIASVSGIPVDMELSAFRNIDVENVHDHPVHQKVKKKRKKLHPSHGSFEETMKEEGTVASKLGMLISPLVEISLSNPVNQQEKASVTSNTENTAESSLSNPVNQQEKASVTSNTENNAETSLSNPVNQQEKASVTSNTENNAESASATTENGTLLAGNADSHSLQALESSLKGVFPYSRRKLLVLDVNGILVDIVAPYNRQYTPDTRVASKAVFKRPFCDDFLQFCFEKFDVGIWSSRIKNNLTRVVDFLMKDTKNKLLFCWDQSHCTATGYNTYNNRRKPFVLKELRYLWWENKWDSLPWVRGYYNETNTILLDDSPYKALRNPPYTAVCPHTYKYMNGDNALGPGGHIRVYLERLAKAENVQKFIQENPFGQNPITVTSKRWRYYSNIVQTLEWQQKEYAHIIPHSSKTVGSHERRQEGYANIIPNL